MGLPLGKMITAYLPHSFVDRLDDAVITEKLKIYPKFKTRSKLISYIIESWLDANDF